MNRNVESYFSTTASADIQRSTFDRSQDIKFSFDVGKLIPFFVDEVYPGDTFSIETSKVVRLQTLLTPVMDNIYLDTYFFFVPNRLVWTHWKNFMGESTDNAWLPQVTYKIPQIIVYKAKQDGNEVDTTVKPGDIHDYLGVPVNVPSTVYNGTPAQALDAGKVLKFSKLPWRAYQLIWNEWFRDENLQDPYNIDTGDNDGTLPAVGSTYEWQRWAREVSKYHDYFTSALPAPLKGEPVLAPVESKVQPGAPVGAFNVATRHTFGNTGIRLAGSQSTYAYVGAIKTDGTDRIPTLVNSAPNSGWNPGNLFADASSLGINIMSLRNAFQVQKLLEADARSGTRYTEIIKGHFSVTSPDSRLQRPEYLGGNRIPISIHQITNQSQGENEFLGDLGAMSLTTDKHDDFTQSFTEHGFIIGVCCARYDHSYPQGLERFWSRSTRFDYYWPEFAHLSEMAILNKEIYAQGDESVDNEVFGYQEQWADLRYKPNRVAGEMRPGINNTLASWHFADNYNSLPHLSSDWIAEDKTNVDRTLAVTSEVANQIFCDVYVRNYTTRPMPVRSIPGLADHF